MFWQSSLAATALDKAGSSLWKSHALEPTPSQKAACRTVIWSSAQSHNVNAIIRAISTPSQAQDVMRVWARDTLVPRRWVNDSFGSIKDLKEIVWDALNLQAESKSSNQPQQEGEKRVMAQYRCEVDRIESQAASSAGSAQSSWENISASDREQASKVQKAYGQHNPLLLDDWPDKERLHPFNHVLLPEFDAARASAAQSWRNTRKKLQMKHRLKSMTCYYSS